MRRWLATGSLMAALSCGGPDAEERPATPLSDGQDHPPVLVNAESPVRYPTELYERKIDGDVLLRLFVDADGNVHPDSTEIVESSGHQALDSAAVAAVPLFRFAPALRNGEPVGTSFLQPVQFRHPDSEAGQ